MRSCIRSSVCALGVEPVLYVYYDDSSRNSQLSSFYDVYDFKKSIIQNLQDERGGILVCQDGGEIFDGRYQNTETAAALLFLAPSGSPNAVCCRCGGCIE
jgi:hypothetical protein